MPLVVLDTAVPDVCTVVLSTPYGVQAHCPPGIGRLALHASPKTISEGYDEALATDWHQDGVRGQGVRIAIIDVGFEGYERLGKVKTDFELGYAASTAHGTAVAEIIQDFAPDAKLYLTSFATEVEFAEAITRARDDHVDIINASIGFDNLWSADGTSMVSRAVQDAVDAGIIVTVAAGNENTKYWVGDLADLAEAGAFTKRGDWVDVRLRWDEPWGQASIDIALDVYGDGVLCGTADDPQDGGGNPAERWAGVCPGVVTASVTGADGVYGWLYADAGLEFPTDRRSLSLPGDTEGALTIGSWDGTLPEWSSRGPTDDDRIKPDLVAATAVSTDTYGVEAFSGTSASAPHAAGLAALWLSRTRAYSDPEAFRAFVATNALDHLSPGADTGTGYGELHADALPNKGCGCRNSSALLMLPLLTLPRRRSHPK